MIDKNSDAYKAGYKAAPKILAGIGIAIAAVLVIWLIIWGIGAIMPKALSNDEIIRRTKQCKDAGLYPSQIINGLTYDVTNVICTNKEDR